MKEEIKTEIENYFELNINKDRIHPRLWNATRAVLKGKCTAVNALIGKRKISNQRPQLSHEGTRKRRENYTQSQLKKEDDKDQSEINNTENKTNKQKNMLISM